VGATGQAEHLLDVLISGGSPLRQDKKQRGGSEVTVFSYETSALKQNPATIFGPLKKKFKDDVAAQDAKWLESLFWDLTVVTPEIQSELQLNGGMLAEFQPDDQRTQEEIKSGQPARFVLPKTNAASTRRVHNIHYTGEVIASDRWRDEWGKAIDQPDVHFRVVYLSADGTAKDADITKEGCPVAHPRFTRRPSASTMMERPDFRVHLSTCGLMFRQVQPGVVSR